MPECYADLARTYDREGRHDDAIALHERAIELGWRSTHHPRSDIAEFHLRAGRDAEAAAIWAELKAADPEDVWLYNAAGLSYYAVGQHELAVEWLAEGIELAMPTGDPEGIVNQLSDIRRRSLASLGRDPDELEQRVDPFLEEWRSQERTRGRLLAPIVESATSPPVIGDAPRVGERDGEEVAVCTAWFPSGEYEETIRRWPSLARGLGGRIPWRVLHALRREHQVDA
jgi:tetratricopeptide (TPR) repeat protein